jgi:hypothetical protein
MHDGAARFWPASSGRSAPLYAEVRMVDGDGNDMAPGQVENPAFGGQAVTKADWGEPKLTHEAIGDSSSDADDLMQPRGDIRDFQHTHRISEAV